MQRLGKLLADECFKSYLFQILESKNLVVYAGAGLTFDKTDLNWAGLARALLAEKRLHPMAVEEIATGNDDSLATSIAAGLYYTSESATDEIHYSDELKTVLQDALYDPKKEWSHGELSEAVAEFVVMREAAGLKTKVLTTNYDTFLDNALETARRNTRKWLPGTTARKDLVTVKHLHGRVPADNSGTFVAPVLSELDYAKSRQATFEAITKELRSHDFLFVGCSVQDTALIEALYEQANSGGEKHQIWLLERAPEERISDQSVGAEVRESLEKRFSTLGITPLFCSYYYEIGQFFWELASATRDPDSVNTEDYQSPIERLSRWSDNRNIFEVPFDVQKDVQGMLQKIASRIRENLEKVLGNEQSSPLTTGKFSVKIEIWALDLAKNSVEPLRLWASSDAVWDHAAGTRARPIAETDTDYAASRAFRDGRPTVEEISPKDTRSRWRTHVAFPKRNKLSQNPSNVPIGSVVVSITDHLADESLSAAMKSNPVLAKDILPRIKDLVEIILFTDLLAYK
ncbi:hypothetical protein CPHO_03735 [Corynebacterium phocae]|uniref:Uncharacterized protein n=1 Tax=Corynebacterium phocae TaxID=161895 RepID=A0A1L7D214_9CORY|nr:SIR2 family protein [Corynebacterium phocae]APT92144.1 hypothetical protein CPHO_03735 [Corynebacterium phocae]KAA8725928.1 SIR2 family protein [Corynebacterium phocae]